MRIYKRDKLMKKNLAISGRIKIATKSLSFFGMLSMVLGLSSCESLYDDMKDCRSGIQLAFNYDYHMERGANAFPANVDCVSVYVFDTEGNYITQFDETAEVLREESYRMYLPLEKGDYHLVVYGGTTCEDATVDFSPAWPTRANGHKNDILVNLPTDEFGVSKKKLHDVEKRTGGLFYGTVNISITDADFRTTGFRTETVHLMKDTNNIQVMLQELSVPDQMNHEHYNFTIIDDNFTLDGYNNPVYSGTKGEYAPTGKSYKPYASETRLMGYTDSNGREGTQATEDTSKEVKVACAEFSTSRLLVQHMATARLIITSTTQTDDDGNEKEIINIPLITYLAMTKGYGESWIKDDQEYLDRQSRWNMMFFLQRNVWVSTRIVVNSWIVRVDPIDLSY